MTDTSAPRRRSVAHEQGSDTRDSRRDRLLQAAFDEFSTRGYAAVTIADIAGRAGVNTQLISYHFGGKEGLYRAIRLRWLDTQQELRADDPDLPELTVRYLRAVMADPRSTKLKLLRELDASFPPANAAVGQLADLDERGRRGQLADDLDPRCVLLALVGMVVAPVALPSDAADLIGDDVDHYAEQLRRIVRRLAADPPGCTA